jgi:hypothetical protein
VLVAYAIGDSHVPSFQAALGDIRLHVVLSARQTARLTCVDVARRYVSVPVFMKNTVNWYVCSGEDTLMKADSPA